MWPQEETNLTTELKLLSFQLIHKLEKVQDNEIGRKSDKNEDLLEVDKLDMPNCNGNPSVKALHATPANALILSHISTYREPAKIRLKRLNYEYEKEEFMDSKSKNAMVSTNYNDLSSLKNNDDLNEHTTVNIETSFGTKHVMDTSKKELCLFYCVCNLSFATKMGLNDHTKMFKNGFRETEILFQDKLLKKLQLKSHC